jgi:hypothetical protein
MGIARVDTVEAATAKRRECIGDMLRREVKWQTLIGNMMAITWMLMCPVVEGR